MDLKTLLEKDATAIVDEASGALARSHLSHYQDQSPEERRARMESLFQAICATLEGRDLSPVLQHASSVAEQRFGEGVDIAEVQAAYNVLEVVLWRRTVGAIPPDDLAEAIGLLATVVGAGRDELARTWIGLATKRHAPSLDLRALFRGGV